MKAIIKKTLVGILTIIASVAFLFIIAESDSIGWSLISSFGGMTILGICGWALDKLGVFKEEA